MQAAGEAGYSPLNTSLGEMNDKNRCSLGYTDFYARAIRMKWLIKDDRVDLEALKKLDKIYMVNGPADLTPLKKFTGLKVLIMNYCGIDVNSPLSRQRVDLEPLRHLTKLEILQCAFTPLKSLEPIKRLIHLRELRCENSGETDLSHIKDLVTLEKLSCGPDVKKEAVIGKLVNLTELYLSACKKIPAITNCKKLQKLSVSESEMAIVSAGYRITNIERLEDLAALEFLDLKYTSYKGNLQVLNRLHLKAITLPPVNSATMEEFKTQHPTCIIINAYQYER
jgi:Leucine-rich repeat (LRR) protein